MCPRTGGNRVDLGKVHRQNCRNRGVFGGERRSLPHFLSSNGPRVRGAKQGRRGLYLFKLRRALDVERARERHSERLCLGSGGSAASWDRPDEKTARP